MTAAVDAAALAAPDSAVRHELAAQLASLRGDADAAFVHWLSALADVTNDTPVFHLRQAMRRELSSPQRDELRALLTQLLDEHPSEVLRASAAQALATLLVPAGRADEARAALERVPGRLAFAVVGTWDNEQGKAFDLELPPERDSALETTYVARGLRLGWRRDAPVDPLGRVDLGALMAPARWSAAFLQTELQSDPSSQQALWILTSAPIKVWVDGSLLFASSELDRSEWDQLIVPLPRHLPSGSHRLLVKSAGRDGEWLFAARAAPLPSGMEKLAERPATSLAETLRAHVAGLPAGSLRALAHAATWASWASSRELPVKEAESFLRAAPGSVVARTALVDALWYAQERGRTSDALQALDTGLGDALPGIRLRQLRFHQQQGLRQRARARLLELVAAQPSLREAWRLLGESHRSDRWREDALAIYEQVLRGFAPVESDVLAVAGAQLDLGRHDQASQTVERWLKEQPASGWSLEWLARRELGASRLEAAERLLRRRLSSWPTDLQAWQLLADVARRRGDWRGAVKALDAATALSPFDAAPFAARGDLAWERGAREEALAQWRRALDLQPENEALANRLEFLAPEARGPWMEDAPKEAELDAIVASRSKVVQRPGADVAWLLDHEVTLLGSDGSTSAVVTHVVHAFNAQGRDRVIRQSLAPGRVRMLHAYAVDARGGRSDASSERNRQVFFRGVQPGSTLVLQYRVDTAPKGYLARSWTHHWTFQGNGEQREHAELVLWAPAGTVLHERVVGSLERTREPRGALERTSWKATHVPPVVVEPSMPALSEVATNLLVSTVPDWTTLLSWEQALLEGAFRPSPEIDELARSLAEGTSSPEERLLNIHGYVMQEIRYQQDYETFIAGVKPHPAPMVLERRYGDCKDKAVLFIALAKHLGLQAHFALVRTRDSGPVDLKVPSQQFNHAIVYVPEQPGISTGRFFDPTADLLDLEVLRADDTGTESLVFDPEASVHRWRTIPFDPPSSNWESATLEVALAPDGTAQGALVFKARGRNGSVFRQLARNTEVLSQTFQRVATSLVPGASVLDVRADGASLRSPAVISTAVTAPRFARSEGSQLRIRLPGNFEPERIFSLSTRRYPLVLGVPAAYEWENVVRLPPEATVQRVPGATTLERPCLSYTRSLSVDRGTLKSRQRVEVRCERISPADYPEYRTLAADITRASAEEVVLEVGAPATRGAPRKKP